MHNQRIKALTKQQSNRLILCYFIITYLISWSIWLFTGVLHRQELELQDSGWLIAQTGVFGPYLSALVTGSLSGLISIKESLKHIGFVLMPSLLVGFYTTNYYMDFRSFDLLDSIVFFICLLWLVVFYTRRHFRTDNLRKGTSLKSLLVSLLLIPAIFFSGWFILVSGRQKLIEIPFVGILSFIQFLILRFSLNFTLGGSLGEEFGWRGFALPLLLRNHNPLISSLFIGLGWALWHIPIDLVAGFGLQGAMAIIIRIIFLISLSIIFTAVYLKSRYKILNMLLMHTSINILSDFGVKYYDEAMQILFLCIVLISIIIVLKGRKLFLWNKAKIIIY